MCPGVGTTPIVVPASVEPLPGFQHPPARGRPRRRSAAATWAPKCAPHGQGRLGVVAVVVGDQHRDAAGAARGEHRLHGGQVRGVVRARVDQHRLAAAGAADDVGVGAVEGHRRRGWGRARG